MLGITVAPSTVWEILKQEGLDPAPERASSTWADFLRSQADAILACDYIETFTLNGQRQYILAVIEHATRHVRVLGATAHPTASLVLQAMKNLMMDLDDVGCRARYLTGLRRRGSDPTGPPARGWFVLAPLEGSRVLETFQTPPTRTRARPVRPCWLTHFRRSGLVRVGPGDWCVCAAEGGRST
ncbi:hypothetical protein, partial [Nonomuraea sp. NPDC049784]|uniref:hypothetical protein n=1 Tax=Nonomuraea sp. NPDC049784 TaxID=3154361 RepID=UPI0033C1AEA4